MQRIYDTLKTHNFYRRYNGPRAVECGLPCANAIRLRRAEHAQLRAQHRRHEVSQGHQQKWEGTRAKGSQIHGSRISERIDLQVRYYNNSQMLEITIVLVWTRFFDDYNKLSTIIKVLNFCLNIIYCETYIFCNWSTSISYNKLEFFFGIRLCVETYTCFVVISSLKTTNFRRFDNSFSAFGESDEHGSTWLTAFVVRSFSQAKPFIYVDDSVINKSIAFLNAQQMVRSLYTLFG